MAEKLPFCNYAQKPCRTEVGAKLRALEFDEYRRAYQCEDCHHWHITSRQKHEDLIVHEPQERDSD